MAEFKDKKVDKNVPSHRPADWIEIYEAFQNVKGVCL